MAWCFEAYAHKNINRTSEILILTNFKAYPFSDHLEHGLWPLSCSLSADTVKRG